MAAILQLRQGSTSTYITQGPNIAEPFFDTGSNILVVGKSATEVIKLTKLDESNLGSFDITGDYSGSNLYLTGDLTASNATLSGDITIGGNIILGDEIQDNITISGQFNSDLIPSQSLQYNLGSQTKKWNHLYASSASIDNIDLVSNLPSGTVSGSTQITDGSGIVSSSTQITDGSGIVSSSNQIDTGSTHFQEGVALYSINGVTPLSGLYGSANGLGVQIRGLSADGLSFDGPGNLIIDTGSDYFVSGAQQASLLGLPQGTVSSSQQVVDFLPTNTVSGSVQVLGGTNIVSSSVQVISFLPSGTVSGSQQIIDSLPTGTVSGSSQISELTHIHSFTSSYTDAISLNGDDVTILGNLTVQGTQTQLNTATLNIEDKNLLIASGAADSSAANGAGITIDGANKSLEWEHGTSQFVFNAQISSSVGFKGDGSNLTGLTADSVEYDNILNKPTLISGSGQVLGGTNIVSSSQQVTDFLPSGTISGSIQVLGGTDIISSSNQVVDFLPSGTISGSIQIISILESSSPGLVSGSDQVTASLDTRYATLGGNNLLSSSNENFSDYSQSVDTRLLDTLSSGSNISSSLYDLVGNFPTSGSLGTAAFYNVSSSLGDDPNVIPNVKAVFDYINNTIQAADITGVSASLGLSGGGNAGYVSLSLDTTSQHFINGVQSAQSYYPGWQAAATNGSPEYIYGTEILYFRGNGVTGDISTSITQLLGVTYIEFQLNTGSAHFLNGVAAAGAPQGTVSSSQQVIDLLPSGTISGSIQLNGENLNLGIVTGSDILSTGNVFARGYIQSEDGLYVSINGGAASFSVNETGNTVIRGTLDIGSAVNGISDVSASISSIDVLNTTQNNRLDSLESLDHLESSTLVGINISNPTSYGADGELQINGTTNGYSGILQLLSGSNSVYVNYVTEADKIVNFQASAGYGLQLTADNNTSKSWTIDTDGDLVAGGTLDVYAQNFIGSIKDSTLVTASIEDRELVFKNTNDKLEGSSVYTVPSTATIAINNPTPSSLGASGELIIRGTTNNYSGIVTLESGSTMVYNQYATESDKMVNFLASSGYGLFLQPDNNSSKAWVVDTDGDLVSQGTGDIYAQRGVFTADISGSGLYLTSNIQLGGNLIVGSSTITPTEFSYLNGVTSDIQTQINSLTGGTGSYVDLSSNQTIGGIKTFQDIIVNGTGSFSYIESVSGSAKIIGDAFIILNNNTPTERYAGIAVYDSGSVGVTSSLQFDGQTNDWFYEYSDDGGVTTDHGAVLFGPEYSTKGAPTYPTNNTIQKGNGGHHLLDSTITDDGTTIKLGSDSIILGLGQFTSFTQITGSVSIQAGLNVEGNATFSNAQFDGSVLATTVSATGDIVAYASSDRRLKDEIQPISNPIEKINQIGGYSFVWNTEKQNIYNGKDYGVIAQEIEEILPELVQTRENGYKAVKYDKLVSLLIEGIKELSKEVEDLKKKIN